MFRSNITFMTKFTEINSFRLNVVRETNVIQDTKCRMGQSFIQFLWGTD